MTTKKFWCHYIGKDGNTPKRRSIELTNLADLIPTIGDNLHCETPLWYDTKWSEINKRNYYYIYAQLSDKVAVSLRNHCIDEYHVKERNNRLNRLRAYQDYTSVLLDGDWITASAICAYEEVQSPFLPVLQELRRRGLEQRKEEERQLKEEQRKREEEEARRKAEAEAKEQQRLTVEAGKFKQGEGIKGEDVVELCRRYGINIHLRTVHNLQQVVADINGKENTCHYFCPRGKRTPTLDGCYKTARELYDYLQTHEIA